MRDGMTRVIAVVALAVAMVIFLAATGPSPATTASGALRRDGGVCLSLEKWGLLGWSEVGRTYSVADIQNGRWHKGDDFVCSDVPEQTYLVRPPFDAPTGSYRLCGIADDNGCIEFEKVEFVSDGPGP